MTRLKEELHHETYWKGYMGELAIKYEKEKT
jgi:hypothetical protein